VSVLMQNIEFAVFNADPVGFLSCPDNDQVSVSKKFGMRRLGNWDLEYVQANWQPRSTSSVFYKGQRTGTATWSSANATQGTYGVFHPLFRMGSLTQNLRAREWISRAVNAPYCAA